MNSNGYRTRESSSSRFLQSDPTGLQGDINTYSAVSNNPLNHIDPDGLRDIFVGGAADDSSRIVKDYFDRYNADKPDSAYYSWEDEDAILKDIAKTSPNDPVNLIGHSYGGDTAAKAALAACSKINILITIDPVSRHRPDLNKILDHVGTWIDVNAKGGSAFEFSNFIAGLGGAWDGDPNGFANYYIQDGSANHYDFSGMMNASGPGMNSPLQVLQGAPMANPPFISGR